MEMAGKCFSCPPLLARVVAFIFVSLACLAIGRWCASRVGRWGKPIGNFLSGLGVLLTLLGVVGVFKSGVMLDEDHYFRLVQPSVLYGVATHLGIPAVWLAGAITVWILAGRKRSVPTSDSTVA